MAGKTKKEDVLSEDDDNEGAVDPKTQQAADVETDEPDVEIVEEGAEGAADDDKGEDERVAHDDGEDDSEGEGEAKTGERHKESAKERRDRAKAAKERDKKELRLQATLIKQLEDRLDQVAQAQTVNQVAIIDERLSKALGDVETFEKIEKAALTKNQGADAVEARKIKDDAIRRANELHAEKVRLSGESTQATRQAPNSAQVEQFQRIFMQRHPWYNPGSGDEDSAIAMAIDQQVALAGFASNTPEYWNELESRIAKRLPKKAAPGIKPAASTESDEDDEPAPADTRTRRAPPVGGGRNTGSAATKIRLSPERVAAIKDAGLWENPKDRQRMAKKYAEYDRERARQ